MVLQVILSLADFLYPPLKGSVHGGSLALNVLLGLVQNGVNHPSEGGRGIALALRPQDVFIGERCPLVRGY